MKFSRILQEILVQKLLLLYIAVSCKPLDQGVSQRDSTEEYDTVKLSTDETLLADILGAENFEIYDAETVLIYKPDRVYQVHVPQEAKLQVKSVEENEEAGGNIESLSDLLEELLPLPLPKAVTFEDFKDMTGIVDSADLVFVDIDKNGDGILDEAELNALIN